MRSQDRPKRHPGSVNDSGLEPGYCLEQFRSTIITAQRYGIFFEKQIFFHFFFEKKPKKLFTVNNFPQKQQLIRKIRRKLAEKF